MKCVLLGWCSVLLAGCAAAGPLATSTESVRPVHVALLTVEGVYNSELTAPMDIFHHTVFHTEPGMRVFTVGRSRAPVTTFEGLRIAVDYALEEAPPIDVLVVPSAVGSMDVDLEDERLIEWVGERGRAAEEIVSICDGAFVLAQAGLLDGRRCTTFPADIPAFRARFPHLEVVEGVTYVVDGPAITGAGGARSFEPALHLVERRFGRSVAQGVARGMVIDWDREREIHLAMPADPSSLRSFLPGDTIGGDVTFEVEDGGPVSLETLAAVAKARAIALCFFGGAAATDEPSRGGLWCEDSFHDLSLVRRLREDFVRRGVLFVGVLCPPVHHEERFGYRTGSFLERGGGDPQYLDDRRTFVERSLALRDQGVWPFDAIVFDPRLRALADPRRALPSAATGDAPEWQGRFKWFDDPQMYGTPTIWILDESLRVVGPPFVRNNYEAEGGKLRYGDREVRARLEWVLGEARRGGE